MRERGSVNAMDQNHYIKPRGASKGWPGGTPLLLRAGAPPPCKIGCKSLWYSKVTYYKKAVLSQRWPRDVRYEPLRRYGHSKLSKMAAAAILNLFESKIAPLEIRRPRKKKPHPITKHEVDRMTGCGDMAISNFSKIAAAAILDSSNRK